MSPDCTDHTDQRWTAETLVAQGLVLVVLVVLSLFKSVKIIRIRQIAVTSHTHINDFEKCWDHTDHWDQALWHKGLRVWVARTRAEFARTTRTTRSVMRFKSRNGRSGAIVHGRRTCGAVR